MKTVLLYPETYVMIIYNQLVNCYYLYESGSGSHRLEILALLHQNMYTLWSKKFHPCPFYCSFYKCEPILQFLAHKRYAGGEWSLCTMTSIWFACDIGRYRCLFCLIDGLTDVCQPGMWCLVRGDCDVINSVNSVWPIQGASIVTREVQIPKYFIRVGPWILTKDPHPRLSPQADAALDLLSVHDYKDLYTFIKPLQFKHT